MPLKKEELYKYAYDATRSAEETDILENDCEIIKYLMGNCQITIPRENRFFFMADCEEAARATFKKRSQEFFPIKEDKVLAEGVRALAYDGFYDFGHTSALWDDVVSLGIYGIRNRIEDYLNKCSENGDKRKFYKCLLSVYDAALKFIERASAAAESVGKTEMASGLKNLTAAPPSDLFESMQTVLIYYVLQSCFDGTYLRTLGRLDSLFYPFYIKEDKERAERLVSDFIAEIDVLGAAANIPFAIGGTFADGSSLVNELSYLLLDVYKRSETKNTKIHFLCSENTPEKLIKSAFEGIRSGKNSIVFMSDERIISSLVNLGASRDDAVRYAVVGCYESGAYGEITCSCNARINIAKALEVTLEGGYDAQTGILIGLKGAGDFKSYKELFEEFKRQISCFCQRAMKITDLYEKSSVFFHTAPILSATYVSALENGKDIYRDFGAKYNNSSLNAVGLATACDSLLAIKKAVFDDKIMTLSELKCILKENWEGREPLRLLIKNKYPKYGRGEAEADSVAKEIVDILAESVNGRPNVKGGKYRLGTFSIDWRWAFGKKTAASADGRRNGETLSQNASASFGADTEGATGQLLSASRLDTVKTPNGTVVDIDLHSTAVQGENGINALVSSLKGYFSLGGFAVHYNVLDTEILKKAKENPERYPSLQVRLCGWNVLFSSLSEKEKEEFIKRSEK